MADTAKRATEALELLPEEMQEAAIACWIEAAQELGRNIPLPSPSFDPVQ
jgi:predicted RNase H-like HicB family nuclease